MGLRKITQGFGSKDSAMNRNRINFYNREEGLDLLQPKTEKNSESGALLIELSIAMTILSIGIMGFLFSSQANFRSAQDLGTRQVLTTTFRNAIEVLKNDTLSNLYNNYHQQAITPPSAITTAPGKSTMVGQLLDDMGNPASVFVQFDVDETNLPSEYGPIEDLDGDGLLLTNDVSSSYQLLPTHLTLTYQTTSGMVTKDLYLVLGN